MDYSLYDQEAFDRKEDEGCLYIYVQILKAYLHKFARPCLELYLILYKS